MPLSKDYKYSQAGMALTESGEGFSSRAYRDTGGVWTIGYGHTGPEVHAGLVWTHSQAVDALLADLGQKHE